MIRLLFFVCLCLSQIVGQWLGAETLDQLYLRKISHAQSSQEIRGYEHKREELLILRKACQMQLHQHLIPSACFESLAKEASFGMKRSHKQIHDLQRRLDERCAQSATLRAHHVPRASPFQFLSISCLKKARTAQQIREYQNGETLLETQAW